MYPDISVIVPVYNCQFYIQQCLESIQSAIEYCKKHNGDNLEPVVEVLVIDDGSTDHSGTIIDNFKKCMRELSVYHTENRGVSAARDFGVQRARGEWISFIDGDDWIEKDYFHILYHAAHQGNADVICCNSIDTEKGRFRNLKIRKEEEIHRLDRLLEEYFSGKRYLYVLWGKMIRKSLAQVLEFVRLSHTEDTNMMLQILFRKSSFLLLPYCGYHYRMNPSGAMAIQNRSAIYKDRLVTLTYLRNMCTKEAPLYVPNVNDQIVETLDVYISLLLDNEKPETVNKLLPLLREFEFVIHGPFNKKSKHRKRLSAMSRFPGVTIRCITRMYQLRRQFYKHR